MSEVWLRTNTRAINFGLALPAAMLLLGLTLVLYPSSGAALLALRCMGGVLLFLGSALIVALLRLRGQPRLAYRQGHLLVALGGGQPIAVPIDAVECFFLGQAPTLLKGAAQGTQARALVVRLAESATDWAARDIKPALGRWCDGYITIRGTWCEPLDVALARRLNERLAAVKRAAANEVAP
jgi:hypothetical protein